MSKYKMHAILDEALIVTIHLVIVVTVSVMTVIIDCSRKKALTVDVTQPSLGENSKISVFNRDGETDIEMPSHLHNVKEAEESGRVVVADGNGLHEVMMDSNKNGAENKVSKSNRKLTESEKTDDKKLSVRSKEAQEMANSTQTKQLLEKSEQKKDENEQKEPVK
ncbi:unnamed protein product [Litomosoides sigmodontis]|uniref:Uncharacterized protein n=1 Tax=Litomosoides sigmodontis TaxID=42156 RepID=A0A3P6TCX5_LITSI|nr:unnamed protein product [Litomosoides sigmodontis]